MFRVAVFCGSAAGSEPAYVEEAVKLGTLLAERGVGVIYGGASTGTMGAFADAVLAAGGEVTGVIPDHPKAHAVVHAGLTELVVVPDVYQRKAKMVELASGFIALPGGVGTVDEIFETWAWAQVKLHTKPIGLVDVNGYYQPLLRFAESMIQAGFLKQEYLDMLTVSSDPAYLLDSFAQYEAPAETKWGM